MKINPILDLNISKYANGLIASGGEDPVPKRPSHKDLQEWNKFVDFSKGKKEKPDVLLAQYKLMNKGFNPNVKSIQNELKLIQGYSKNFRRKDQDMIASETYSPVTISGNLDTNTLQKFPTLQRNGKDYGVLNGDFKTETEPPPIQSRATGLQAIPQGARIETTREGLGYWDDVNGNFIPISQESFALYKAKDKKPIQIKTKESTEVAKR